VYEEDKKDKKGKQDELDDDMIKWIVEDNKNIKKYEKAFIDHIRKS